MKDERSGPLSLQDFRWFRNLAAALIVLGILAKFYDIAAPWKTNDHYNFGGVAMTIYGECLKTTPLGISKGIPHSCWMSPIGFYRAHESTLLFGLWGWTSIFGSAEWAYRLFFLTFSTFNIFLIFQISRLTKRSPIFPWLAAMFQATFLGGIYFATHPDFIGEVTVTFILLTAWLAMRRKMTAAALMAIAAGITSWPGYIVFAPLWLYSFLIGQGRKRVFLLGGLGVLLALATMMWLQQTSNIIDFLHLKLVDPGYVKTGTKWSEPFHFLRNFVSSQARLLGPIFCVFAFFELIREDGRDFVTGWSVRWRNLTPFHHAVLLCGGTGFFYALLAHQYFIVHVFLYLLLTPGLALLAARFIERMLIRIQDVGMRPGFSRGDQIAINLIGILFASLYPYGIFKTNVIQDATTSVVMVLSVLAFLWLSWRGSISRNVIASLLVLGFACNASEMIGYRNEPDTERSFCRDARAEYQRTGQPIHTKEPITTAKEYVYCRGIPIVYETN
jgi:hypothetical protein